MTETHQGYRQVPLDNNLNMPEEDDAFAEFDGRGRRPTHNGDPILMVRLVSAGRHYPYIYFSVKKGFHS
jgi:hypothetical protein